MDEAARAIIHIRIERADEELRAARNLIEDGLYRIACSRAYYFDNGTLRWCICVGLERRFLVLQPTCT